MPKKRAHKGKLAKKASAKDVVTKVDPKLDAAWKKLEHRIHDAQGRGAEAYDELWEAVGQAVHHNPPLYVLGGYKSASDFFQRALHTDLRSAERNIAVAEHATPKEEEDYGESNIAAALDFIAAKFGKLGKTLPVAFDRLKIPVRDGTHTKMVPFPKATVVEIQSATRTLQRKNAGEPITDRTEAAIVKVLSKHAAFKNVKFSVRAGLVHVRAIPVASLALFARVLSEIKLPAVDNKH
ncbi:MAG TPA: hypothetical protein VHZ95_05875 [Polyangiales bacterium]|jgi:hypothetical protein|nr:hypothetical protein [Polyangiales bacterium]